MLVYAIADATDSSGGYVAERLVDLGATWRILDRDALPAFDEVDRPDLVVLLGSDRAAHDPRHVQVVMAESRFSREALADAVPVMGICYGAQLLARALGGTSWAMDAPELGWSRIDTLDDVLCPRGPWAQFHYDTFAPPQNARVLGSTWYGPQAFVDESHPGRVIAWQFHPEVDPPTYARWVDESASDIRRRGEDPDWLKRQARQHAASSRRAARDLTDAALNYLQVRVPTRD